jgi:hypothetical protein
MKSAPAATAGWSDPSSPTTRIATCALAHRSCLTVELCGTFVECDCCRCRTPALFASNQLDGSDDDAR